MIKGLEHVAIMVSDMKRSIEFYQTVLGLTLRHREWLDDQVELAFLHYIDQPNIEIELVYEKGTEVLREGQVNHVAFRVEQIKQEMERLRQHGIVFDEEEPLTVLGSIRIAFFTGPDGEILELVER